MNNNELTTAIVKLIKLQPIQKNLFLMNSANCMVALPTDQFSLKETELQFSNDWNWLVPVIKYICTINVTTQRHGVELVRLKNSVKNFAATNKNITEVFKLCGQFAIQLLETKNV